MQHDPKSISRQPMTSAFVNAANGIAVFFRSERNGKVQGVVTLIVVTAGFILKLSPGEWIFILLCISTVLVAEMMNSALEHLCNLVHNEYHLSIKKIKDVSAGAVLVASVISVISGFIIFLPKIIALL